MPDKTRILVVDDDALARQIIADSLTAVGYQVVSVHDGAEAAEALDRDNIDVVVTDLILPRGDGLQVLADAKKRDPGIEVIVITGLERVDPAVRAIKSGAADYLVKPVTPESLQQSIARCVATRKLLSENSALRSHLALLETGQRLATTLEREKLFPMAVRALKDSLSAEGALLLARKPDGTFALAAQLGFEQGAAEKVAADAAEHLKGHDRLSASLQLGAERWSVLFAEEGEQAYGAVLLRGAALEGLAWSNAHFLVRHLALGLKNLDRFSAVEDLAYLDDLTKLYNTRYLHVVLDREISNSKQTGAPFSVLFLDLDHFKQVNDTHGHLAGSKTLVEMGALLKGCVRDVDVVARYGGDEYVIVLLNTDAGGALKVAERIRRSVEAHRFLAREGMAISLTTCIGVASYPEHARDKAHILEYADKAMYRGKRSTRNVIYIATPEQPPQPAT